MTAERRLETLAEHPEVVLSALAAAADTLAAGVPAREAARADGEEASREEVRALLARLVEPLDDEDLLSSDEVVALVGFRHRASVHHWLKQKRLIGLRRARRGVRFPKAQFDERGEPLAGLDVVQAQFGDAYAAWW